MDVRYAHELLALALEAEVERGRDGHTAVDQAEARSDVAAHLGKLEFEEAARAGRALPGAAAIERAVRICERAGAASVAR